MKRITIALLLVFAASAPANALDVFLEIPGIQGESADAQFPDHIVVISWSQSVANVNNMPVVLPLVFTHLFDTASPKLIEAAILGTDLQQATLRVRSTGGQQALVFLTITLHNPRVVSVKNGGSEGENRFTEIVTLTCASFEYRYVPTDQNGLPGNSVEANGSCGN